MIAARIAFATFSVLMLLCGAALRAQDVDPETRADIDSLTSYAFRGRGYLGGGHLRAADFIARRFRQLGLDSLSNGYLQQFPIQVNEFTALPHLAFGGTELRLGTDFVPHEASGSGSGSSMQVMDVGTGVVTLGGGVNMYDGIPVQGNMVVLDEKIPDAIRNDTSIAREYLETDNRIRIAQIFHARAVAVLVDRPTMGKRGMAFDIPVFEVRRDAFPHPARGAAFSVRDTILSTTSQNVAAVLPGIGRRDSFIVICAHYDHLGCLGDSAFFPGANDNASGTALMLDLAHTLQRARPSYSVLFLAFSGEEAGLIGSRYFFEHPLIDLKRVRFLLNLDMTASGNDGIMAVGGVEFPSEFEKLREAAHDAGLDTVRKRPNAPNSDHYFFLNAGTRGFYVYPFTGYQPYHSLKDVPATLEWNVFARFRAIMLGLIRRL